MRGFRLFHETVWHDNRRPTDRRPRTPSRGAGAPHPAGTGRRCLARAAGARTGAMYEFDLIMAWRREMKTVIA
ncbi:hypothetical protein GCM10023259_089290 [Thermocatellispora tengchongensis]